MVLEVRELLAVFHWGYAMATATGVKRGPLRQNKDPEAMLAGIEAAHKYVRRLGGPALPLRTFSWHVQQNHVPHMRVGRTCYFWPRELREWLRLPPNPAA